MSNKELNLGDLEKGTGGAGGNTSAGRTHVVKNGDTLWDIAVLYYKDGCKWEKIYEANKAVIGKNPNKIQVGMKLYIP